jgi:hypothetical protein
LDPLSGIALSDENAATYDGFNQALIAQQAKSLLDRSWCNAVTLYKGSLGWDGAARRNLARLNLSADDRSELPIDRNSALMIDLHMIKLADLG